MRPADRPPWLPAWRRRLLRGDRGQAPGPLLPAHAEAWVSGLAAEGLIAAAASGLGGDEVPRPYREALAECVREQTAWRLLAQATLRRVLDALERADAKPLVLKGLPLAQRLFGDVHARDAGDLDVLVLPDDLGRAAQALRGLGFAPRQLEAPRTRPERTLGPGALTFSGPDGLDVDLHWSLGQVGLCLAREPAAVAARARPIDLGGLVVRTLADEDQFVYLAAHGGRHAWSRAGWVRDVATLLDVAPALDGEAVIARARTAGLLRHVGLALALARREAGTELPPWSHGLAASRSVARLLPGLTRPFPTGDAQPLREHLRRLRWHQAARERGSDRTRDVIVLALDALRWRGDAPVSLVTALLRGPWRVASVLSRRRLSGVCPP